MSDLTGTAVAFLATDGFEDSELTSPWNAVKAAGGIPVMVGPRAGGAGTVTGKNGHEQTVQMTAADADVASFAALVLPGGTSNADHLRVEPDAVELVKAFADSGKTIAVICHGSWILTEANAVRGKRMTSFKSLQTDLRNAGADWVDEEVVVDGPLISSRTPKDLPAFNQALLEALGADSDGG